MRADTGPDNARRRYWPRIALAIGLLCAVVALVGWGVVALLSFADEVDKSDLRAFIGEEECASVARNNADRDPESGYTGCCRQRSGDEFQYYGAIGTDARCDKGDEEVFVTASGDLTTENLPMTTTSRPLVGPPTSSWLDELGSS